jgi:hypothetical protein
MLLFSAMVHQEDAKEPSVANQNKGAFTGFGKYAFSIDLSIKASSEP